MPKSKWIAKRLQSLDFIKLNVGKVLLSSSLPRTITTANFHKFQNTPITSNLQWHWRPIIITILLCCYKLGDECKAQWELFFMIIITTTKNLSSNDGSNKPTTKEPFVNIGLK